MSEGEVGYVTSEDVAEVQAQFRPGSVVSASRLYEVLSRLMHDQRRPLAHQVAFGHALRREGWDRQRIRRRVNGKQEEYAGWHVPGRSPVIEQDEQMMETLRTLGGGIHSEELIWTRYRELIEANGWRWTLSETDVKRWLTRKVFVRMGGQGQDKGKKCRFVAPERLTSPQ